MKTVVLASGGLDSSVLMFLLKRERTEMLPVHVNYGQLAEAPEWSAVKRFCHAAGLPPPTRVDASGLRQVPSGLTRKSKRWAADPFFPGRNLFLATVGAAMGYSRGYRTVAIGLVANALYPDQTGEFVNATRDALSESFGCKMQVTAPLLRLTKRKVAELGRTSGAPVAMTYSCQRGSSPPCGLCSSCADRVVALKDSESGVSKARRAPLNPSRGRG